MQSIETSDHIYIYRGCAYVRGLSGIAELLRPQPPLLRILHIPSRTDLLQQVSQADAQLRNENVTLFAATESSPSERTGFLFEYTGMEQILLEGPKTPRARKYYAKLWHNLADVKEGGYLATGPIESSLWRIVRIEADHLNRARLFIRSVRLPTGLPRADFTQVSNSHLRAQLEENWQKLEHHITQKHQNEVVTSAKNILEGLLAHQLAAAGQPHRGNLKTKLDRIRNLLDEAQASSPLDEMSYHLGEKIRLLHQRTHAERAAGISRPVRPEFPLGVIEDLLEILSALEILK